MMQESFVISTLLLIKPSIFRSNLILMNRKGDLGTWPLRRAFVNSDEDKENLSWREEY